jgi:GH24 family phage-related lysozyme (muramidase)
MHEFEGFRNRPYLCSAKIWTIGYGHVQCTASRSNCPMVRKEGYTGMIREDYQLKPEDSIPTW